MDSYITRSRAEEVWAYITAGGIIVPTLTLFVYGWYVLATVQQPPDAKTMFEGLTWMQSVGVVAGIVGGIVTTVVGLFVLCAAVGNWMEIGVWIVQNVHRGVYRAHCWWGDKQP